MTKNEICPHRESVAHELGALTPLAVAKQELFEAEIRNASPEEIAQLRQKIHQLDLLNAAGPRARNSNV